MLVKPVLDELMTKVDSKYTLVTISARRARKIMEQENNLIENPVTMALDEIDEGSVTWERCDCIEEDVR
ncbi:MAG: DNA-directed RNA polymerase subunit omega [Clostridiales bacterium]